MPEANYEEFVGEVEDTVEKSWHVEGKIQEWVEGSKNLDELAEKHNVTREGMEEYMDQDYY